MAVIELQQTDNGASYNAGSSGAVAGVTTNGFDARDIRDLPAAGVSEISVDAGTGTDLDRGVLRLLSTAAIGETIWDAGDYVVNLDVTTIGSEQFVEEIYVDELQDDGTTYVNVVNATAIQRNISTTAQVETFTLNRGSSFVPKNSDSKLSITIVFQSDKDHGGSSVGLTPSQTITTPIEITAPSVSIPVLQASHRRHHELRSR